MPGLNIYTSNKLEILAAQLAQLLKTPVSDELKPEIVVIQSPGMERWISQELARQNGICGNIKYPFPNTFLDQITHQILSDDDVLPTFDPDVLMFEIMKLFPVCLSRSEFERLKTYLEEDPTRLKELQIAGKLADLYDQYLVFRPEMIFDWEQGAKPEQAEDKWQAEIWRLLLKGRNKNHRARRQRILIEKMQTNPALLKDLLHRLFMFGISYLPLFHLETFAALSQAVETNVFLLNPCQEYWGDIVSEKQMQRIRRTCAYPNDAAKELHLEEGNRLLASMGGHGKDFHTVMNNFDLQMKEDYSDPGCETLLSCIQSDILNLRERRLKQIDAEDNGHHFTTADPEPVFTIEDSDTSIQIHSCHSPMREVEVLHDHLLVMFADDSELLPRDIVVMTPDIETYAPFIQAVFGAQTNEHHHIPFNIADRGMRGQGGLIDGFFAFLELKDSRLSVTRVMRLLEAPGVRKKFGLNPTDLEAVERWIRETRIRWGIDAGHRSQLGLPAMSENTWSAGIRQLLLGYAMPGYQKRMFEDILPYDSVEGSEIHSFGKFLDFCDAVFTYAQKMTGSNTLQAWSALLKRLFDDFFRLDEDTQWEATHLRSILDDLGQRQKDADFNEKLEFEPIRFYLEQRLDRRRHGSGFMTGGVTFCAMLPMRSIPFKIVCLVGMNSDTFPRDSQPLSFDLIARHPRLSDRSRRNDDKYLFLESIISARNKLYISYVGQSIQDNSRIPPSVLVSELMDTIESGFEVPGGSIREHVVHYHRLQAFAPQYFQNDPKLFSFSAENCDAAVFLHKQVKAAPLFTQAMPLSEPEKAELQNIDIESLLRFFSHPTRYLLQQRLGIYLEQTATLTDKREDFQLDALEKFYVGQNMVNLRMANNQLEDCRSALMAAGQFPHGNVGHLLYDEMSRAVEQFAGRVEAFQEKRIFGPSEKIIDIDQFKLQVRLPEIYDRGLVLYRYAGQRGQDLLKLWICHLALCTGDRNKGLQTSTMIFKDSIWQFNPVEQPRKYLSGLIDMFISGLERPLHFFPKTSLEYVQQLQIKGKSEEEAMSIARQKWVGDEFFRGESANPYFDICFKMTDPLDTDFADISKSVFEPVLAHGNYIKNAVN